MLNTKNNANSIAIAFVTSCGTEVSSAMMKHLLGLSRVPSTTSSDCG